MYLLGLEGMPRRYYDYLPQYTDLHVVSTVGSWITAAGLALMAWNLWRGLRHGAPCGPNPWGAATLEWTLPSPPPTENFGPVEPEVTRGPYDFKGIEREEVVA
jgi:cytochrome c oxidase subunit 1